MDKALHQSVIGANRPPRPVRPAAQPEPPAAGSGSTDESGSNRSRTGSGPCRAAANRRPPRRRRWPHRHPGSRPVCRSSGPESAHTPVFRRPARPSTDSRRAPARARVVHVPLFAVEFGTVHFDQRRNIVNPVAVEQSGQRPFDVLRQHDDPLSGTEFDPLENSFRTR